MASTDYIPQVGDDDLRRVVERDFAVDVCDSVIAMLEQYKSVEPWRVRLSILKLADGDMERVRAYVQDANDDSRDVLAWAECPRLCKVGFGGTKLTTEQRESIRKKDWEQYVAWLHRP